MIDTHCDQGYIVAITRVPRAVRLVRGASQKEHPLRRFLALPLLLLAAGLIMGLSACGDDDDDDNGASSTATTTASDALTLEQYMAEMDKIDKDTDALFDEAFSQADAGAVYDGVVTAVAFAGDETAKVDPPSEVKELHDNLIAGIGEFEQAVEEAGAGLDRTAGPEAVEAVFPDTGVVDEPFCALQAVADERGIEADVGCDADANLGGGDPAALPAEATDKVLIEDFAFQPAHISVQAGDEVTWTQGSDPAPHTATSVDGVFDSGTLEDGDTFAFTFAEAGEYAYFCEIHPDMLGLVTVTP